MPPNPELLHSLGRLVRGLSALFWGLPIALIVCVQTARGGDTLRSFGFFPPVIVTAWLLYGLWQLGQFQRQERVWRLALERAGLFGVANLGLAPFLFWWTQMPNEPFYQQMVLVLAVTGLIFLGDLNLVLRRLTAMLPDETLRLEARQFTALNRGLLMMALWLTVVDFALNQVSLLPPELVFWLQWLEHRLGLWLLIALVLLPLSVTMALLWKTKEVVLAAVFGAGKGDPKTEAGK